MPRMKPPQGAAGATYNGMNAGPDGVDVLERDVADLLAENWELIEPPSLPEED